MRAWVRCVGEEIVFVVLSDGILFHELRDDRKNEFDFEFVSSLSSPVQFSSSQSPAGTTKATRGKSSKNSNSTDNATKTHKNGHPPCTFSSHHTTLLSFPSPALSAGGPPSSYSPNWTPPDHFHLGDTSNFNSEFARHFGDVRVNPSVPARAHHFGDVRVG